MPRFRFSIRFSAAVIVVLAIIFAYVGHAIREYSAFTPKYAMSDTPIWIQEREKRLSKIWELVRSGLVGGAFLTFLAVWIYWIIRQHLVVRRLTNDISRGTGSIDRK